MFSYSGKGTDMLAMASIDEDARRILRMARNLARIYAEVLEEPLPDGLRCLIEKWGSHDGCEGSQRIWESLRPHRRKPVSAGH